MKISAGTASKIGAHPRTPILSWLQVTLNGTDRGSPLNSGGVRNSESELGSA